MDVIVYLLSCYCLTGLGLNLGLTILVMVLIGLNILVLFPSLQPILILSFASYVLYTSAVS